MCQKYDGAEDAINDRIEKICPHEKVSAEEVIYFLVSYFTVYVHLSAFFSIKIVSWNGI